LPQTEFNKAEFKKVVKASGWFFGDGKLFSKPIELSGMDLRLRWRGYSAQTTFANKSLAQ